MHWFSKSVPCQRNKRREWAKLSTKFKTYCNQYKKCLGFEGHSLLFTFFHQSPSSRKKKGKPFGADNDDDDNDEGWCVGGWSFDVIILWFLNNHLRYWLKDIDLLCRTFVKTCKEWKGIGCWIQSKGMLSDWVTEWLMELLSDWVTDWLTNWLTVWLTVWLTGGLRDGRTISFISVTCALQDWLPLLRYFTSSGMDFTTHLLCYSINKIHPLTCVK